jgi:multiple sugar transport system ATP-binding protein
MVEIAVLQPTGSRSYTSFRIANTHMVAESPAHTISAEGERIAFSHNMEKKHLFNAIVRRKDFNG